MTQNNTELKQAHFSEWTEGSKVNSRLTELNIYSLSDPREIDELLNRNTKQRWKHWEHGPGWAVAGVNPETGERTYDGAQFKPDTPVQRYDEHGQPKFRRDGSPDLQKYFSASEYESVPLFLDTGDSEFWSNVLQSKQRLIITEGAKKAGAALSAGEACISLPGVSNGQRKGRLKPILKKFCTVGRAVVLGFDSDMFHNPSVCKALDKLGRLIAECGSVVRILALPQVIKGVDDFIVANGYQAFQTLIDEAWTFEEWRERFILRSPMQSIDIPDFAPQAEQNYILKATSALFTDTPYIAIDGQLYKWLGTHYALQSAATEKKRIADWCQSTPVQSSDYWEFKYATSTHVDNVYSWVIASKGVDLATINPPGLNCLNGVLQITWQGNQPSWQLVGHDPKIMYTYVGEFEFDPCADPSNCDRLLSCLDPAQQRVFIQTLAASLDLQRIRYFRGRGIKALLCKGHGNNGKDSLREAVQTLYGVGVVGATVNDFLSYDQGRKFTLAKLEGARISWSSENSSFSHLDSLQSLKAAITGETLDLERKGVDERQMAPNTVFLFNVNDAPSLQASLEAIQSRWAVLSFHKTFKTGADPSKGEIEADPRFRYDPNFLKKEVVPALLNKMLAILPEVASKAIDYSCTEQALQAIQEETNHLWSFVRETGINYQVGGRLYINDLWELLREWYVGNGTLIISTDAKGKEKSEWHEQPRRGDKNVKAANQVYQRFSELFPKITKERDTSRTERTGQFYLAGIGIVEAAEADVEAAAEAVSLCGSDVEAAEAISPTLAYALKVVGRLSPEDQQVLLSKLVRDGKVPQIASAASTSLPQSDTASAAASTSASAASTSASAPNAIASAPTLKSVTSVGTGVIGSATSVQGSSLEIKTGDSTNNFFQTVPSTFKLGDRVAHVDPAQKSHSWHGTVVGLEPVGSEIWAKVRWQESRKEPMLYRFCDLRLI